ncbi:hypothetical protein NUW54_g5651 [Trametes sanguinea]|uniref:Uncharacterized protein n=1 Tax=Trametes sanguinea TaxID=158606 RepID=A0ACC1PUJ3_9APHY|nr:hypothetical protein NUW54_g5651 [Trametes sanguinea]
MSSGLLPYCGGSCGKPYSSLNSTSSISMGAYQRTWSECICSHRHRTASTCSSTTTTSTTHTVATMSYKQDKATTERHARTLRELLKRPENKTCADCKRNDPRWASWNLGVFLCIRCSGIHRSMGTHISKVKSVDLDVWTPEQMASIQKWGNRRANLYWEAHLRAGHVPPDQ